MTEPQADPPAPEPEALAQRIEQLRKQLALVSNKETRAELLYAIAQAQWQLGEISDEQFHAIEKFYEEFTYEWC
jgi:hypothetical protein